MKMYELDPDVVRWGLHFIDVCSLPSDGSRGTVTCYQKDMSHTESVMEGFCNPAISFVENDEVIAHALQEELSRVAASEKLGSSSAVEEHQKEYILSQEWLSPSGRHFTAGMGLGDGHLSNLQILERGFQNNEEGPEYIEAMSADFEGLALESEYQDVLPEIEDELTLDGELGKRLNQMVPVPHVPKINGEIPSVDEATLDHQRLLNRLQLYDLVELKISGDGNCQFRSLSDQIYRTPEHHKFVRQQVVDQLKSQPEFYENYVPMAYGDYLKKMSKNGEWGDHVTLQAAADCYGIKIFVITSFKDTCYIEILPQVEKSNRTIFLSFWSEVHYNSIYPLGEVPLVEAEERKRRWWK